MCLSPIPVWLRRVDEGKQILLFRRPSDFAPNASPTFSVPCGKCPLCLERKRKDWIRRITCETWLHDSNSFVTFTYNDEHLPQACLASKKDIQKFLKRFRNSSRDFGIPPFKFKYFITSEYGDKFGRPHYHGILFGVDFYKPCWKPRFVSLKSDGYPIFSSEVLEKIWNNGFVSFDRVTPRDIAYVTKYITKSSKDTFRLYSRGLGKNVFFNDDESLTKFGKDCFNNGFVVFPSGRDKFFKASIPKNIDRYASIYEPMLFAEVKGLRRAFASAKTVSRHALSDAVDAVNIKIREENKKRIIDHET